MERQTKREADSLQPTANSQRPTAPEGFIYFSLPSSDLRAVTGALLDVTQDAIASGEYDGELIFNLFLLLRTLTDQIPRG